MKKLLIIILTLALIPFISAIDSISCIPSTVAQGGSITCEIDLADGNTEKNKAYNITFYNNSAESIMITDCSFTGTTENSPNPQDVIHTCDIPSDWGGSTTGVVNFSLTSLETSISFQFNVSEASSSTLIIDEFIFKSPILMGKQAGARWTVSKQDTGKAVLGASCSGDILQLVNGSLVPIAGSTSTFGNILSKYEGHSLTSFTPIPDILDEGTTYVVEVRCDCIPENGGCIDEDGTILVNSSSSTGLIGIGTTTITTDTWLTVNTLTDKTNYNLKEELFICTNVTNVIFSKRTPLHIFHQIRCSNGDDNNDDLDRILIVHDEIPDSRRISTNTTQMQCKKFRIPELRYLQGQTSECYASTDVMVLDETHTGIVDYYTISPTFNITSSKLNLETEWQWVEDKTMNSILNLSDAIFNDFNGTGTGNIDIRIEFHEIPNMEEAIIVFNSIKNTTIKNTTGGLIEHVDFEYEFLEDGFIELELRNVPLNRSDISWWNITLEFYDLNLRNTDALEGIENKTGTFRMDVDCPSQGIINDPITCTIQAQVEESQLVEKEVDFTCYIKDGNDERYAVTNFNKMITRNISLIEKDFLIPNHIDDDTQLVLQCEARYYNLGSRQDQFFDTFTAIESPPAGDEGGGGAGLTGEGGIIEDIVDKTSEIIQDLLGVTEETADNISKILIAAIMFLAIFIVIVLIIFFLSRKKKNHNI